MKKALIPGMFSSISDAELVTAMLDAADFKEHMDAPDEELDPEIGEFTNQL